MLGQAAQLRQVFPMFKMGIGFHGSPLQEEQFSFTRWQ